MTDAASRAAGPLPPLAAAVRSTSWLEALADASLTVVGRPDTWVIALAGFLVRGGLVVLVVPIVVLPSPIALAASFGLDAVSISGEPTSRFIIEVTVTLLAVLAWVVLAAAAGGVVEIAVGRRVVGLDDEEDAADGLVEGADRQVEPGRVGGPRPSIGLVSELVLARLVTLLPVVAALVWGIRRIIDVGYREVTVPSDTATPLVVRIAQGAWDAVIVIVVAWLAAELVLAIVTRHMLFDRVDGRSATQAARLLVRRPLLVLLAFGAGMTISVLLLAAGVLATQSTWDRVAFELRAGAPIEALLAIVLLVLVWTVTLVGAAFLSAWRSALVTGAYLWTVDRQDGGGS